MKKRRNGKKLLKQIKWGLGALWLVVQWGFWVVVGALVYEGLVFGTAFLSGYLKYKWNLPKQVIVGVALLIAYVVGRPFAESFGGRFERFDDDALHRGQTPI